MRHSTDPVPREPQNSFQSLKLCSYCLHRPSLLSCRYVFFIFQMEENMSSKSIAGLAGGIVMRAGYFVPWENSLHSATTTGFPAKWRLRDERINAILMTWRYTDLGSESDWSGKFASASQKHYPNCALFSDVISRGNQWWRRQTSAVFLAVGISIRLAPKLLKLLATPPAKNNTNLPLIPPAKQATNLIYYKTYAILLELVRKCNVLILINVSLVVSTTPTKQSGIFLKIDCARRPL